jgi:hypothetical protein
VVLRNPNTRVDIDAVVRERSQIRAAFEAARRDALLDHKRTGDPIVIWENGQVVWIPAEKIEVEPPSQSV